MRHKQLSVEYAPIFELYIDFRLLDFKASSRPFSNMTKIQDNRWYLAYGSSISPQCLLKQGVVPLASHVVCVPNAKLRFNVHFLPFWEPVLANLEIRKPGQEIHHFNTEVYNGLKRLEPVSSRICEDDSREESSSVLGVAYLLTAEDYKTFIALECKGTPYKEVAVQCYPLTERLANHVLSSEDVSERSCSTNIEIFAHTLVSKPTPYSNNSKPSRRYIDSMLLGATEQNFPTEYCRMLNETPCDERSGLQIIPAIIFLFLWAIPLLLTLLLHEAFSPERSRSFIASLCRIPYRVVMDTMWMQYQYFWEYFSTDSGRTTGSKSPFDNSMGSRRGLVTALNFAQSGPMRISTTL